jgi:FtsP/CotA-like multicopper oxidase with cupredoxin domain
MTRHGNQDIECRDSAGKGTSDTVDHQTEVSRRALIRTALLGAAAIPAASGGVAQTGTPEARHGTPTAGYGSGQPSAGGPPVIGPADQETWNEPWVWRPSDWPGQQLDLNVVEHENPGAIVGFGNPGASLFAYNGSSPGPTIRMRGDEALLLKLRNLLGENFGETYIGPYPDPNGLPSWVSAADVNAKAEQLGNLRHDFCLGEHTNGVHSNRVTNIHSHGLHVRPGQNLDGTMSDNVIFRLIDQADITKREEQADNPSCDWLGDPEQTSFLRDDELSGYADYEFRLGDVQSKTRAGSVEGPQPHPPGTHWYHPHCHGATHNQVSSGMAGFLIVEGDVDAAINLELTGQGHPDPQLKTAPYDYIERLMFIQRVFVTSTDPDAPTHGLKEGGANPAVNGDQTPMTIIMRPGAIERWRILNGSVDGQGFNRFMVLKGQYAVETTVSQAGRSSILVKLRDASTGTFTPATRAEVSADKQTLYQLAFDGITLVTGSGGDARYTIKNLAEQNASTENPLDRELSGNPNQAMLANLEACFRDAESIRNCYVRPNEIYLGLGNRADVFFQAPRLEGDGNQIPSSAVFTVLARGVVVHSDTYQNALQSSYTSDTLANAPEDIVVAYVVVSEGMDAAGNQLPPVLDYDVMSLANVLPEVPEYLLPVEDDEVMVKAATENADGDPDSEIVERAGKYRTRTITYSGWGAADYPLVTTEGESETANNFREFIERDQAEGAELELLRYAKIQDSEEYVLLAPNIRTMAISGSTSDEVIDSSDPLFPVTASMAQKFNPTDPTRPMMLESTAEEWALYNYSISLWADTAETPLGQDGDHFPGQPLLRAEGQARFAAQPDDAKTWRLQTKGVDHPFHIHQNPCWVSRIEVPDENGNLVNILDEPRWQDVVWIPRNGGRVVFRSRFPDYIGPYVNHCHILLHEDHGMMQVIEITPFADQANYELKDRVTSNEDSADAVTEVYPRYDQARAWLQGMQFVDSNHATGQKFPGFVLGPPPG